MSRNNLRLYTAIFAAMTLAACSSNGRVAFGAGGGGSITNPPGVGGGGSGSGGAGGPGSGSGSGGLDEGGGAQASTDGTVSRVIDTVSGGQDGALAAVGNVGDLLLQSGEDGASGVLGNISQTVDETGLVQTADETLNPLGRVTVGDDTLVGSGSPDSQQALGVSVLSPDQSQGDVATLGVLSNGQILSASTNLAQDGPAGGAIDNVTSALGGPGDGLVGVAAGEEQVIGQGENEAIGVSVLSPEGATGETADINVFSEGQLVDVDIASPQGDATAVAGGLLNQVTSALGGATGN